MENIKELYNNITDKQGFQLMASDDLKVSVHSIRAWFRDEKIPEKHLERFTELLQNTLVQQRIKIDEALKQSASS